MSSANTSPRRWAVIVRILTVIALLGGVFSSVTVASANPGPFGDYIVVFRDDVNVSRGASEHARQFGAEVSHQYRSALPGYAARIPDGRLNALRADPRVLFVVEDQEFQAIPPDPVIRTFSDAGDNGEVITNSTQFITAGIRRVGAEHSSTASGDGQGSVDIDVAIIDSGIDLHPDLNVAGGINCLNNGKPDDWIDRDGHGTIAAGLVAAIDNDFGAVGVAPGARVWAVRVAKPTGLISTSSLLCGINWVTQQGGEIEVMNMSLGMGLKNDDDGNCGRTSKDVLHMAICAAVAVGTTPVASAGNSSTDLSLNSPGSYPEVLVVTAMTDWDGQPGGMAGFIDNPCIAPAYRDGERDDTRALFSNYAVAGHPVEHQTVSAPGVCVSSTFITGLYATAEGTSFSAPIVAGAVALCIGNGACAGLTPLQIIDKIVADAAAQPAEYGFLGDTRSPQTVTTGKNKKTTTHTVHYGNLVYVGNY